MRVVLLILLIAITGCSKQKDCTVSKVYSINEEVKSASVIDSTTVYEIEKEYLIVLECY